MIPDQAIPEFTSKQQILDHVVKKLAEQGFPAHNEQTNDCCYINDEGARCAVGWLIPTEKAAHEADFHAYSILARDFLAAPGLRDLYQFGEELTQFLCDLQKMHDGCPFGPYEKSWSRNIVRDARAVADRFDLSTEAFPKIEAD